jgi:hypothetical protein
VRKTKNTKDEDGQEDKKRGDEERKGRRGGRPRRRPTNTKGGGRKEKEGERTRNLAPVSNMAADSHFAPEKEVMFSLEKMASDAESRRS